MTRNSTAPCLVDQPSCGQVEGQSTCPKCGMDSRLVFPNKEAREAAQTRGLAMFWENHSKKLEADLKRTKAQVRSATTAAAPPAAAAKPPVAATKRAAPAAPVAKTKLNPQAAWPFPTSSKP